MVTQLSIWLNKEHKNNDMTYTDTSILVGKILTPSKKDLKNFGPWKLNSMTIPELLFLRRKNDENLVFHTFFGNLLNRWHIIMNC